MPTSHCSYFRSAALLSCAFLLIGSCSYAPELLLQEKNTYYQFDPEVRVLINSPAPLHAQKPTLLIIYALPNGNSIEMTAGRKVTNDLDWHYDIQHIAAQTRFLRRVLPEKNVIVAYAEAKQKSWPAWRQKNPANASDILRIIQYIRFETGNPDDVAVAGHSGGGSFITGFMNAVDSIPHFVRRIAYLDANYSYEDSLSHGKKLFQWLTADTTNVLAVVAYDDREIRLNGKKVIGPTGGTFRATYRMIQNFVERTEVLSRRDSTLQHYAALNNRARFIIHTNPDTLILHTVLVEKNGFIHAMLINTPAEERSYTFFGERTYQHLISEE